MSDSAPVRVHICEDSSEMRLLIRRWLERDDRLSVVGEASNGTDALEGLACTQPDVALLDLSMPRSLGAGMIPAIRACAPHTRVLVVTGTTLDSAQRVLDQADGYVLKPAPMPQLAGMVYRLADGRIAPGGVRRSSEA